MTAAHVNGKPARPLSPEHRTQLMRGSGLSDETIAAAGLYTESDGAAVGKALCWKYPAKRLGPCLAFPFFDAAGQRVKDYLRYRPDKPRAGKEKQFDGRPKPVKYESPAGKPNRAYFPPLPAMRDALADPTAPLLITEGEKKSLKATQEGFPTIGLVGVEGWSKRREKDGNGRAHGERELLDDLAAIGWDDRPVYIVYDSDAADKFEVRQAEAALALALSKRGAVVKIVRLPPGLSDSGPKLVKQGLDDYLAGHHSGEDPRPMMLRHLLDTAPDFDPNEADELKRGKSKAGSAIAGPPTDPNELAKLVVATFGETDGLSHLVRWSDEWLRWDGAAYRELPDKEWDALAVRHVQDHFNAFNAKLTGEKKKPLHVGCRLLADVRLCASSITMLPAREAPPAWIGGARPDDPPPAELLCCRNGLVNLAAWASGGSGHLIPPTPRYFCRNALDYDFRRDAPSPVEWLKFLISLWPDDLESVLALQEWFGYLLSSDTAQQKILLMLGPRRSGKGTIARVLRSLVGMANCCGPTLSGLADTFGLQPLVGKSVAIVSDARLSGRTDQAGIVERLLAISGEDSLSVPRKFREDVNLKLPTRFVVLTNEFPRLSDASGALVGRLIVLRLAHSFYGKEDTALTARLLAELPGILLWAVAGWQKLRERGHFLQPESGRELVEEAERLTSPVLAFVADCCRLGPALEIRCDDLYDAWKRYAEREGHEHAGTKQLFGKHLHAAVSSVRVRNLRNGDSRARVYAGIGLKPEYQAVDESEADSPWHCRAT